MAKAVEAYAAEQVKCSSWKGAQTNMVSEINGGQLLIDMMVAGVSMTYTRTNKNSPAWRKPSLWTSSINLLAVAFPKHAESGLVSGLTL